MAKCPEDVLKKFLQDVLKTSWRHITKTNILVLTKTSSEDVRLRWTYLSWSRRLEDGFKTSWSRPAYLSSPYVFKTSTKRLAKTSSRRLANTFWRHLQDILKAYHQSKLFLLTSLWVVFSMFVGRTAKTVFYRRIHLGHTSEKFTVSVQNLQEW